MFYKFFVRPVLFRFDPERIHHKIVSLLEKVAHFRGTISILNWFYGYEHPNLERNLLGLTFKNPVGLAAGFDKDARLVDVLPAFGFGFIEVGTTTPLPQPGNDKPRMFRLPKDKAIINRMGFNNEGIEATVSRLRNRRTKVVIGGNIGKNKLTPNENALDDYTICFEALYPWVDYFVINVSSPNTPGLRELQEKEPLTRLLIHILNLCKSKDVYKPVLLKIAPDLTDSQLSDIVGIIAATGTDGLIATNTTISRDNLKTDKADVEAMGMGGLSGLPLKSRSLEVLKFLRSRLGQRYPIISVGGIMTPEDALERLEAGADLIQVYTGFVYEGPGFVRRINRLIARKGQYAKNQV